MLAILARFAKHNRKLPAAPAKKPSRSSPPDLLPLFILVCFIINHTPPVHQSDFSPLPDASSSEITDPFAVPPKPRTKNRLRGAPPEPVEFAGNALDDVIRAPRPAAKYSPDRFPPNGARPAAQRPTKPGKRPQVGPNIWVEDSIGGGLIVLAVLMFLSLYSYDPHDLPTWAPFNPTDTQNLRAVNFIGRTGAMVAFYSFMLTGMATYLVAICSLWFGVCKIMSHVQITGRHWLGLLVAVLAGASIIDIAGWGFGHGDITPLGNGGAIGRLVGGKLAYNLLGPFGSVFVLIITYGIGMVFASGMHPIQVIASARQEIPEMLHWTWQRLFVRKTAAATSSAPEPTVAESAKRKGKASSPSAIGSSTATVPPAELFVPQELPLNFNPEPKIIDSSAPKLPDADANKPMLADVWEKKRKQKIEQTGPAPAGSLTERFKDYRLPSLELLHWPDPSIAAPADPSELRHIQDTIVNCLASFQITVTKGDITRGPAITRYEVRPVDGLRVNRISALEADIARATKAERINILAPIPGKDTVGIEIANKNKVVVPLRELLEDDAFQNGKAKLPLALGKDVYGKTIIADLAAMPHMLVAGATGSGKSVCINSIVTSLVCRFAPDELRFIMIDPKVVEMQTYANLPHLALPVVTDPKKALLALRWVVREMETRYQIFAQEGCRNFDTFNSRNRKKISNDRPAPSKPASTTSASLVIEPDEASPENSERLKVNVPTSMDEDADASDLDALANDGVDWSGDAPPPANTRLHRSQALIIPDTMPYVVVIIDELADLMQTAPADIEVAIARITQMARAAGIHMIVATQTPRADVVTGVIKANIPSRIAFQVASATDSRIILDRKGAEKLVGKGDMLYLPPGTSTLVRSQGAYVTDEEIHALVDHCVLQGGAPTFDQSIEKMGGATQTNFGDEEDEEGGVNDEDEQILEKCVDVIRQEKKASTSLLQRRLGLGYTRAARMMDILEDRGIIGPGEGAKPREILVRLD